MANDTTVSMWCQALNDQKRRSMQRIQDLKSQAVHPAEGSTTCYQCASQMPSSIAGLCIKCTLSTRHESPQLENREFPIPHDDVPELAFTRTVQHALLAVDPDLITALLDHATKNHTLRGNITRPRQHRPSAPHLTNPRDNVHHTSRTNPTASTIMPSS